MFLFVDGGPGVLCGHPHGVHCQVFLFVDGGPGVLCRHPYGVHHCLWRGGSGHSVPELELWLETRQGRPQEALLPDVRGTLPRGNRRCVHRIKVLLHAGASDQFGVAAQFSSKSLEIFIITYAAFRLTRCAHEPLISLVKSLLEF